MACRCDRANGAASKICCVRQLEGVSITHTGPVWFNVDSPTLNLDGTFGFWLLCRIRLTELNSRDEFLVARIVSLVEYFIEIFVICEHCMWKL